MADGLLNKASIILTPTGYKAGTLYNVAPVVEPYEDFDFARASVASRVNSSGLVEMVGRTFGSELVVNGDFSDGSNGWFVTNGNVTDKYNASMTAYQSGIKITPFYKTGTYRVTFDLVVTSGSCKFDAGGGNDEIFSTSGSKTIYVTNTLKFEFNAFNLGWVGSLDNVSVKEVIDTNNIPRISYDSNGENGHILLEPTSTNLVTYSEDFSQSAWIKYLVSVDTNNTISPQGISNAAKITEDTSNGEHLLQFNFSQTINTNYSYSVFVKANGRDYFGMNIGASRLYANFDLTDGSVINVQSNGTDFNNESANITSFGNGWYKCTLSGYALTTNGSYIRFGLRNILSTSSSLGYLGDGVSGAYVWGAQLEALSYATSYIPTLTGSTVTRATETATGAGSADLINSTEGVLYAEIAALRQVNDNIQFLAINSSSYTQNSIYIQLRSSTNQIGVWAYSNGSNEVAEPITLTDITSFNKIAIRWKVNDFNIFINGASVFTDTSYNAPTSNSLNSLEFARGGSSNIYCKCKALAVFNEALSDAELNNLTG